jgi:hypothetical protein
MKKKTPETRQSSQDEEEIRQALRAGMNITQAAAYPNDPNSFPGGCGQGELSGEASGSGTEQSGSGERTELVAAPLSPEPTLAGSSVNTGHHEDTDPERLVDDSDRGASQALPMQNSKTLSECDSPSGANDEGSRQPSVPAPAKSTEYNGDRDRRANGQWQRGVSGNPRGRKPKQPSNDSDHASELKRIVDKKIKVKDGGKERTITKGTAIFEQWTNQAAKGDHRARRELIAYAEKHGIDLFAGQQKAIQKGIAETARSSSAILTEEVLERLSNKTLEELTRVVQELEAEKKKKVH